MIVGAGQSRSTKKPHHPDPRPRPCLGPHPRCHRPREETDRRASCLEIALSRMQMRPGVRALVSRAPAPTASLRKDPVVAGDSQTQPVRSALHAGLLEAVAVAVTTKAGGFGTQRPLQQVRVVGPVRLCWWQYHRLSTCPHGVASWPLSERPPSQPEFLAGLGQELQAPALEASESSALRGRARQSRRRSTPPRSLPLLLGHEPTPGQHSHASVSRARPKAKRIPQV